MTTAAPTGAAGFLARYEGLKDHLPGARKPWLNAQRADAAVHFAARGFLTRRVEQWKTDLGVVAQAHFAEPLTRSRVRLPCRCRMPRIVPSSSMVASVRISTLTVGLSRAWPRAEPERGRALSGALAKPEGNRSPRSTRCCSRMGCS